MTKKEDILSEICGWKENIDMFQEQIDMFQRSINIARQNISNREKELRTYKVKKLKDLSNE